MFEIIIGFRNVKRELGRYLLLMLELAVATVFACICCNVMLSYREYVRWNQNLSVAKLTEVAAASNTISLNSGLKITPEDYQFLKEKYQHQSDFKIVYYIEQLENFYDSTERVIKTVPVLYVNEEYSPVILQAEGNIAGGVMSDELRNFLSGESILPMGNYECKELLEAAPGKLEALEIKEEFYTRFTANGASVEGAISYQDCVLFPLSAYTEGYNGTETAFMYLTASREVLYQNYAEFLDYLFYKEENLDPVMGSRRISYSFENQMQGLERANELSMNQFDLIFHYMIIGVGIIFINMCGILLLTVSRRQTEYALQLVVGAGRGQIYLGMLIEIGTIVLIGLLLGAVAAGYIISNGLVTVGFPLQNHALTFVILGLSALFLIFISSLPFVISLLKLEPTELLQ